MGGGSSRDRTGQPGCTEVYGGGWGGDWGQGGFFFQKGLMQTRSWLMSKLFFKKGPLLKLSLFFSGS